MGRTKRPRQPLTVWYVTWTTYADDYKMRGQVPFFTDGPFLFREQADAEAKVVELMRDQLAENGLNTEGMSDERVRSICYNKDEEYGEEYGCKSSKHMRYAYSWVYGTLEVE